MAPDPTKEDLMCGVHQEAIETLKKSDTEQWEAINKLRNRPPIWTTAVISLLTFLLGCCVTYATVLAKMPK